MSASRYAPAREDGLKPYVRESYHFGETYDTLVYAASADDARNAYARMHLERVTARRATPDDVARLTKDSS